MADLSEFNNPKDKSNWELYVKQKGYYKTTQYEIAEGFTANVMWMNGNELLPSPIYLQAGWLINITSGNILEYEGNPYAEISYRNISGYIPVPAIKRPNLNHLKEADKVEKTTLTLLAEFIQTVWPWSLVISDEDGKDFYTIPDPVNAVKCSHDATADFRLFNNRGTELFISHKKAGSARAFQQYAGISGASGLDDHKEVQSFKKKINGLLGEENHAYRFISDPVLINKALFGREYGKDNGHSENNCHMLVQGNPIFEQLDGKNYRLRWSHGYDLNGQPKKFISGDYRPCIGMTHRDGRNTIINGKIHNNVRLGIYPYNFFRTRASAIKIK